MGTVSAQGSGQSTESRGYRQLVITPYHVPIESRLPSGKWWLWIECARACGVCEPVSLQSQRGRATQPL